MTKSRFGIKAKPAYDAHGRADNMTKSRFGIKAKPLTLNQFIIII